MVKAGKRFITGKVRAILKVWRANNPQGANQESAVQLKIAGRIRGRLKAAFNRGAQHGVAVRDLGCSIAELKTHLETLFQEGMTWENYGRWHIDHKTPLSAFDLTKTDQVLLACHWSNLQPLWARDNLSKGAKTLWQPELTGLAALVAA
jgi:hypothetical protein